MKLFFREYRSLIFLQMIQSITILGILLLAEFQDYTVLLYSLFLSFIFLACYLTYKYRSRRKLYQLLSHSTQQLDDSLQPLDNAPISEAVATLLRSQYNVYQEKIMKLHKKQNEHLIFIDRWIHQMKTPLSVLELLAKELDEPDSSNIREEIDRLKSGLSTVMYMSRLRTIEQDFHIERVQLLTLFEEIKLHNKRLFIRNNVYPVLEKGENIIVETDEKWLFFMINQLISNAIKYSSGQSNKVIISIDQRHEQGVFEIKDHGVGIPQADLKRIFDAFYTGENGRKFRESTGVGLYIVREVATYLGHNLEVESTVGKGATFRIIF